MHVLCVRLTLPVHLVASICKSERISRSLCSSVNTDCIYHSLCVMVSVCLFVGGWVCVCACVPCRQGGQFGDPVTQDRQKQSFSSYRVFSETLGHHCQGSRPLGTAHFKQAYWTCSVCVSLAGGLDMTSTPWPGSHSVSCLIHEKCYSLQLMCSFHSDSSVSKGGWGRNSSQIKQRCGVKIQLAFKISTNHSFHRCQVKQSKTYNVKKYREIEVVCTWDELVLRLLPT